MPKLSNSKYVEAVLKNKVPPKKPISEVESDLEKEEQFDLKLIIKIISEKKTDEASIELVRNYFYDSWDLMINGEKVEYYLM
jgi:hypothetical protein